MLDSFIFLPYMQEMKLINYSKVLNDTVYPIYSCTLHNLFVSQNMHNVISQVWFRLYSTI